MAGSGVKAGATAVVAILGVAGIVVALRQGGSGDGPESTAEDYLAAWEEGDTGALVEVLAPDATVYGDGGGKAPAMPVPLVGAERVAKALIGWGRQARERGLVHRRVLVNGEPGLVFYEPGGSALWVAALEIAEGVVVAVRSILNPDKLTHVPSRG